MSAAIRTPLTDEEMAELHAHADCWLPSVPRRMFEQALAELRTLRASALSDVDVQTLTEIRVGVTAEIERVAEAGVHVGARHLALLDRLITKGGAK